MPRKRDGWVPSGAVVGDLAVSVPTIPAASPQARRGYTISHQISHLLRARESAPELGFMARTMALCSLPRSNPGNRHQYKRVNGPFKLIMVAGGDNKLPYGNLPRLLMSWVCSEAVKTGSRELVLGRSVSEFMRRLGIYSSSGEKHTRLRNQMDRLFNAHVSLVYEDEHGKATVNSQIADSTAFWWNPKRPDQPSLWESRIELSEKFFNEITSHPVPLNMETLKALKRSSLGLDLYLWLVYRTFPLRAPLQIAWRQVYQQFGAHPAKVSDKRTVQNFRTKVLRELKKIKLTWDGLNYSTAPGVLILLPSTPSIPPAPEPLRLAE